MPKVHGLSIESATAPSPGVSESSVNVSNGREMVGGCCVCSEELGWDENPLVYCDGQGCNVAVHQACYGIVSVPTGPWYCRKCESQERTARVRCELCPSRDGALKRTSSGGWAHVVCALYIPEVRFGNVSTMEPIILTLVPPDRYSRVCYICQQNNRESKATYGACMECNRQGCKQNFHVTCAQSMGLLCEEAGNYLDNVKYCGYCHYHYQRLNKKLVKTIPAYKPVKSQESLSGSSPESSPHKDSGSNSSSTSTGLLHGGSVKCKKSKKSKRSSNLLNSHSNSSVGNNSSTVSLTTSATGSHHGSEVRIEAPRLKLNDNNHHHVNTSCSMTLSTSAAASVGPTAANSASTSSLPPSKDSNNGGSFNYKPLTSKELPFALSAEQHLKSGNNESPTEESSRTHQPAVILKFGKQDNGTYYKKDLHELSSVFKPSSETNAGNPMRRAREHSREEVRMEADSTASEDILVREGPNTNNKLSAKLGLVETSITPTSSNNDSNPTNSSALRIDSNTGGSCTSRLELPEEAQKSSALKSSSSASNMTVDKSKVDLRLSMKVPSSVLNNVNTNSTIGSESTIDPIRLVNKSGDVTIESVRDEEVTRNVKKEKDPNAKFAEPDTSSSGVVQAQHTRGELIIEKAFSPKQEKDGTNSSPSVTIHTKGELKSETEEQSISEKAAISDRMKDGEDMSIDKQQHQQVIKVKAPAGDPCSLKNTTETTPATLQPVKIDLSNPPSKAARLSSSSSKKVSGNATSRVPKKGQHVATNPLCQVNDRVRTDIPTTTSNTLNASDKLTASEAELNEDKKKRKIPTKRSANGTTTNESASWMLGATLNPSSAMAKELNMALQHEIQSHSAYNGSSEDKKLVGVPLPTTSSKPSTRPLQQQSSESNIDETNKSRPPRTLHELLERQWEEGSQFLMEQASHFDIASLLSSLHQLKQENSDLETSVERLVQRRDHLLAVQARLLTLPAFTFTTNATSANNSSTTATTTTSTLVLSNGPLNTALPPFNQQHRSAPRVSSPLTSNASLVVSPRINSNIGNHVRDGHQHVVSSHGLPNHPSRVIDSNGLDYPSMHSSSSAYAGINRRSNSIDSERLPPGAHLLVVANNTTTAGHPRMMNAGGQVSSVTSRYHHAGHVGPHHHHPNATAGHHHYIPNSGHRLPPPQHMSNTPRAQQLIAAPRGNAPSSMSAPHPFTSAPSNYPISMHHHGMMQQQHGPPMRPNEPKR